MLLKFLKDQGGDPFRVFFSSETLIAGKTGNGGLVDQHAAVHIDIVAVGITRGGKQLVGGIGLPGKGQQQAKSQGHLRHRQGVEGGCGWVTFRRMGG